MKWWDALAPGPRLPPTDSNRPQYTLASRISCPDELSISMV